MTGPVPNVSPLVAGLLLDAPTDEIARALLVTFHSAEYLARAMGTPGHTPAGRAIQAAWFAYVAGVAYQDQDPSAPWLAKAANRAVAEVGEELDAMLPPYPEAGLPRHRA